MNKSLKATIRKSGMLNGKDCDVTITIEVASDVEPTSLVSMIKQFVDQLDEVAFTAAKPEVKKQPRKVSETKSDKKEVIPAEKVPGPFDKTKNPIGNPDTDESFGNDETEEVEETGGNTGVSEEDSF